MHTYTYIPPSALRPPSSGNPAGIDPAAAAHLPSSPAASAHPPLFSRALSRSRLPTLSLSRCRALSGGRSACLAEVARGRPHGVSEGYDECSAHVENGTCQHQRSAPNIHSTSRTGVCEHQRERTGQTGKRKQSAGSTRQPPLPLVASLSLLDREDAVHGV